MTDHRQPLVTPRLFPLWWSMREEICTPWLTANREDVFFNHRLPPNEQLVASRYKGGDYHFQTAAPRNLFRRLGSKGFKHTLAAFGVYIHLYAVDRLASRFFCDQWSSPYYYMSLREKVIWLTVPNRCKPDYDDMYKMCREAALEVPWKGVNMWSYRLETGRVPRSFFDDPPLPYQKDKLVNGFRGWLNLTMGIAQPH
eukprot:NODE_1688_length_789_cov_315.745946_g1311_i0.p1 GENE.NODE_1688_length_789_cov_315.745946_g1311_i0~~NODE_1688_length_789_cov_315.745946_g1311_i0.p1  ORF type:complete len:215 (-),score=34.47 NODE_1688_length_789_cov_315.745946_g1311_i0:143-736(-)